MAEIKIDETMLTFGTPKFWLGQKVIVCQQPGYVIGIQREKYSWSYLFAEGDPPTSSSSEDWYEEHRLSAA
jgi:hypothetical protein